MAVERVPGLVDGALIDSGWISGLITSYEDAAGALANASAYRRVHFVPGTELERRHRVVGRVRVATSWRGKWLLRDLSRPSVGGRLSGIGREGRQHSPHLYIQPTNVCVQL